MYTYTLLYVKKEKGKAKHLYKKHKTYTCLTQNIKSTHKNIYVYGRYKRIDSYIPYFPIYIYAITKITYALTHINTTIVHIHVSKFLFKISLCETHVFLCCNCFLGSCGIYGGFINYGLDYTSSIYPVQILINAGITGSILLF